MNNFLSIHMGSYRLDFLPQFSSNIAIFTLVLTTLAVLVTCYLAYQRIAITRQKQKKALALCIINLLAYVSILGLVSNLSTKQQLTPRTVVVTSGIDAQQWQNNPELIKLRNDKTKANRRYIFADTAQELAKAGIALPLQWQVTTSLEELIAQLNNNVNDQKSNNSLQIVGDGFFESEWDILTKRLPTMAVQHNAPANRLFGLVNMQWQPRIYLGDYQRVTGKLQAGSGSSSAPDSTIYVLNIRNPVDEIISSTRLKVGDSFALTLPTTSEGSWIYSVTLAISTSPEKIILREKIPFSVALPTPINWLIYQSSPSFETRHLKNWASEHNNKISIITKISQNNSIQQHLNYGDTPPNLGSPSANDSQLFTQKILAYFDIMIMDGRSVLNLSADENQLLAQAISDGLGLLIIADIDLFNNGRSEFTGSGEVNGNDVFTTPLLSKFTFKPIAQTNVEALTPVLWRSNQSPPTPFLPFQLETKNAEEWVISKISLDNNNDRTNNSANYKAKNERQSSPLPLVISQSKGLGKVAISLLSATYQWNQSGNASLYSHYWQNLSGKIGRESSTARWLISSLTPFIPRYLPTDICALSNRPTIAKQANSSLSITLNNKGLTNTRVCTTIWPKTLGWQHLQLFNNDKQSETSEAKGELSIFTFGPDDWQSWQQQLKTNAGKKYNSPMVVDTIDKNAKVDVYDVVPKWIFWMLLVITCTLLWAERKGLY